MSETRIYGALLRLCLAMLLGFLAVGPVYGREPSHGISYFGDLKYARDFPHFDYVNVDAPKGGRVRTHIVGTYNSLHPFASKGIPAFGIDNLRMWTYDRLMLPAEDELYSAYGLLAESVELADDYTWVAFTLREEAYWHDGVPVTVEDVVWTFNTIKTEGSVGWKSNYRDVVSIEQVGPRAFKFHFSKTAPKTPQLAMFVSGFRPLPKHYWKDRTFNASTLDPPLGNGPYRIKEIDPGHSIVFERVNDYWGKDLNVNVGYNNFEHLKVIYFLDKSVALQALRAGVFDYFRDQNEKDFATAYDFPGHQKGFFKKVTYTLKQPYGMHWGVVLNARLEKLRDVRVREALTLAYNHEWTNRVLQFGAEKRNNSFFMGSALAARGLPSKAEIALLEAFRGQIPPRVFTHPVELPENDLYGRNRDTLLRADALLNAAGWVVRDNRRVDLKTGVPLGLEFILSTTADVRQLTPYADNLRHIGIAATLRRVDSNQIVHRMRHFDFEATVRKYYQFRIPLAGMLRGFFLSANADRPNMDNFAGIKNPAVDFLVEKIIAASSEEEITTAGRALDRILLWSFYLIPGSYPDGRHLVYWDRFGHPPLDQGMNWTGFPYLWWLDKEKSDRVDGYLSETAGN